MNRRCSSGVCIAKAGAMSVSLDLPYAAVLHNPRSEWRQSTAGSGKIRVARSVEADWSKYTLDKYLFSHVSIVSSVELESDRHTIKVACNDLINNNGNAWANDVLLATFRTFIGAENYLEHVQVPELSKGKIIDAVARPVKYRDGKGHVADVWYVDLLVATDRKHRDLISKIESGELNCLSMGCLADYVTCSRCGGVFGDSEQSCSHIENELGRIYFDRKGNSRVVAELCGRYIKKNGVWVADPESVEFIEASWVEKPAFAGAVINHFISEVPENVLRFAHTDNADGLRACMDDVFKLRVADRQGMLVLHVARREMARIAREKIIGNVCKNTLNLT